MGFFGNFFKSTGFDTKTNSMSTLTPEQQEYLKKLLPSLWGSASGESNAGLESMLGASRTSAESNFQNKTLPQIMASAGTLHSGSTSNRVGQQYNEMQQGLTGNETGMRYQNQQQGIQQLLAALGIGGTENIVDKPGMLEGLFKGNALGRISPTGWGT